MPEPLDLDRTRVWAEIAVPCLVLAFEHDIDSPPASAREAAARIPGCRDAEIPDASHRGIFTHAAAVAAELVDSSPGCELAPPVKRRE